MFADISKPSVSSYAVILVGTICIELIVLFLIRLNPDYFGKPINDWYNEFSLNAVIADVLSMVLGLLVSQGIYRLLGLPWNLGLFIGIVVAFQLFHDLFFHFFVVTPIPERHNAMIDVFKRYNAHGSYRILIVDSLMMTGSALVASFLATQPISVSLFTGTLAVYAIPYILATRNKFSKN
jgi:hypothetical protein